jgi:hypothetical protein
MARYPGAKYVVTMDSWFFNLMIVLIFITALLVVLGKYKFNAPDSVVYGVSVVLLILSGYLIFERLRGPPGSILATF